MNARSAVYNPDAPISADQRSKRAIKARASGAYDPMRTFSRWELDDLRMDLLSLSSPRADRFLTLMDQAAAADEYRATVSATLDDADLEGLADTVTEAEDDLSVELLKDTDDEIDELLSDNPDATPTQLLGWFKAHAGEERKRLRKEVADAFERITKAVDDAKAALGTLD